MSRVPSAAALLLLAAVACGGEAPGAAPTAGATTTQAAPPTEIRYAVRLRDGGTARANLAYLLPDGERHEETVTIPWESGTMHFPPGATVFLSASTFAVGDVTLLCVLQSEDKSKGAYVLGKVTKRVVDSVAVTKGADCASEYVLGAWPPPDDDPDDNLMIRVG